MKLLQLKSGAKLLIDDNGNRMPCPYTAPFVIPTKTSGPVMNERACGSNCPMFEVDSITVELHCCKRTISGILTEVLETEAKEDPKPDLKIVKK